MLTTAHRYVGPYAEKYIVFFRRKRQPSIHRTALAACAVFAVSTAPLYAFELYNSGSLDLRWDNDLRYSAGIRTVSPNALTLTYPNADDGDRNFTPGMIMNRFDLKSVLDATSDDFGAQLSIEAWYDTVYQRRTANTSPGTYNAPAPSTQFAPATVNLNGHHADLSDTFVYGDFDFDGMPLSVRLGRQTLLWGESLFFDLNGIAAAMAPVDYIKRSSTPDGYARDVFLPVNQLSFTAQFQPDLSLAAYYQLEWRADRLPGVGSYFSDSDVQGAGAYRAFLSSGRFLLHEADRKAPNSGQYGVSLRKTVGDFDLGLYALRFNAKYPVLAVQAAASPLSSGYAGTFESLYPAGTDLYGFSFSTYLGDNGVAGEISTRRNMPLVSDSPISLTRLPALQGNVLGYAAGDTLHAQLSSVTTLGPSEFWDSADLSGEIAANDVLKITENPAAFDPERTRAAASIRMLFQPHYFQAFPNLDVTPLVSVGYGLRGHSAIDYTENAGAGDAEFGISATYLSIWRADLTFTTFFGKPYRQPLVDRDFLMLGLERSFLPSKKNTTEPNSLQGRTDIGLERACIAILPLFPADPMPNALSHRSLNMPRILTPADVAGFRNRLCDVGMQLFIERGFEGFHMRELAHRLGVSAMTPYRYFKDKEEIMAEIRVRAFAQFADWLEEHLAGSGIDGNSLSSAYSRFATQEPAQYRLMFDLIQPASCTIPALAAQEQRVRDVVIAHLRALTGHDLASSELELRGQILWSILHGTAALYLSGKLSAEDLNHTLSNAVRYFVGCTIQAKDAMLDFAFGNGHGASWRQRGQMPSTAS